MTPKTRFLTLAIAAEDLAHLTRCAAQLGVTRSEYCRRVLLRARHKPDVATAREGSEVGSQP